MIRNETFHNGVCISAEVFDLDARTFTREENGEIIEGPRPMTLDEWTTHGPQPLDSSGALATLLVVEGLLSIDDAANAVGVNPADLVIEAEAWGAASGGGN